MRAYKFILLLVPVLFLQACGGGYDEPYDSYYEYPYIDWAGSVNGTIVLDATGDEFEFELYSGFLHFGNTTYTNAWVDDYGDFYVDGFRVGGVYYVRSYYDEVITALVSNNGYFIDIYGPESDLAWTESTALPVYAFRSGTYQLDNTVMTKTARESDGKSFANATTPGTESNAIIGDLPEGNQGILGH